MIRIDYESVQEAADALRQAAASCVEATVESGRNRDRVAESVAMVAASRQRVEELISAMSYQLDLAEHKAANVQWSGESYDRFYEVVQGQRANIRKVEQQYRVAYAESMAALEHFQQQVDRLDEMFGRSCEEAGSTYQKMSTGARRYSDRVREISTRGLG